MARVDDYKKAVELSRQRLATRDAQEIATHSGATMEQGPDGHPLLALPFLQKRVLLEGPGFQMTFRESGEEPNLQEQVLILHYLNGATGAAPTGEWVAYQEIPDGKFYIDAFLRRAKNPMVNTFGDQPEVFIILAKEIYDAQPLDQGDAAVTVQAFPRVPVALILWRGDDEFPPEGTILFDRSIGDILSAEDIAWLAGMIVYPLMGMAKGRT